ncbi:MAG: hypothetical protein ACFFAK_02985 [Promethearchaeota archaeon]
MNRKKYMVFGMIIILILSSVIFLYKNTIISSSNIKQIDDENLLHTSGQNIYNKEWLDNNDFSTQAEWFYTKGAQGDNSTVDANISNEQANYKVIGDNNTYDVLAGEVNSSTWYGWSIYNNSDYLLPDVAEINATGCYIYHYLDEGESGGAGQVHNFPSVHFRKNISVPNDMSDYEIISTSLEVIFNATVDSNVDAPGDIVGQSAIWDSATFYVEIADLDLSYAFRVGEYKTTDLGQDFPPVLSLSDRELIYVSENDLITALNLALEKDPSHSEFTIILGVDIYCEDNDFPDYDRWEALIFKSFNLTFTYRRIVDKFSSISWNQIGNQISGGNIYVSQANLKFKVKMEREWPTALSPFSEVRILINDNPHSETLRLSSVNTTFQDAKAGGFDVKNLILKDVNITLSIQVFIANNFDLGRNITFSIDEVYLNITYIETFPDYGTQSRLYLNTEERTADPYIQIPLANSLNITITYFDNLTLNHISGATVKLEGKISRDLTENLEQYSVTISTSELGIGLWSLTVIAQRSNYQSQSISFFVDIIERPTEFQLFVDSDDRTNNNTVKVKYNELMNITAFYRDYASKLHLSGANVSITGIGNLDEINEQYNIILNSNSLGLGFKVLTIMAKLQNYTIRTFQLYVEVFDRTTELRLYVNSTQKFNNDIIQVEVDKYLNLTTFYLDDILKTHLSGATISLFGIGNFSEVGNQYYYSINSIDLNPGFNVLTINARLNNYETQTIQIYVEVFEKASEILLFVDSNPKSDSDTVQVEVNQLLNVTVFFRDDLTKQHLSSATVQLIGWGMFSEIDNQYNFTINTNDLEQGITILTIYANLSHYQSQNIKFYVEVTERATELKLYIDGIQRNETDTIQAEVNQFLNLTVYYRDNLTKFHLAGATVVVIGIGNFSEISNYYNLNLNTNDLEHGISILTVFAHIDNYQPQTFQFYVEVSERASKIELFLNNIDKTADPVFDTPIGSILNITVRYIDNQTDVHISGGNVQLIDGSLMENFTEFLALNQYTLYLNTSKLKIGVNLLTIIAHANNFQIKTLNLRITVSKINTLINTSTGESFFSIKPGEGITLSIVLSNIDFGGTIKNATVTYRWAYGQGELQDPDNDGIYEAILRNVPAGTYTITITAFAGDEYDFESYEITLNVVAVAGVDLSWLIFTLMGAFGTLIIVFISYQTHFKYPPMVRKIRKLKKKIRKGKKIKSISLNNRKEIMKNNYNDQIKILDFEKKQFKVEDFKNLENNKME